MEIFGIIRPTFEEYPNRYADKETIVFEPQNPNYSYDENDIIEFFNNKDIKTFILINPDNPTGNYIKKSGLLKLVKWAEDKKINIIIDESFVDFANEEDSTIIDLDILNAHKNLYIIKSISKSYGVPGLRLGVLASGNTEMIDYIKKDVSIWNINSFAEFYMQIYEKYKNDYNKALVLIRNERDRFEKELLSIKGIRVIPSQANYVMCEITNGMTAKELSKKLLINHQLFIKDLSKKLSGKQFIRLAVRDTVDNDKLIKALKEEI